MNSIPSLCLMLALTAAAFSWLTGCSTAYDVRLDSISRANLPAGKSSSYAIRNKNPAIATDTLRYNEAADRIRTALSGRGLWEAPSEAAAEMIVELDYDIDPAHTVYKAAEVPVYVPTCPVVGQMAPRELIGQTVAPVPNVVCEKHLSVSCRENEPAVEGRPTAELWRISVSIEDARTDLRECLPVLASVVMDQIGTTTDGVTTKRVDLRDSAVDFIKKGI
jgi:hypothetical protein